jgi:hypothetical protein
VTPHSVRIIYLGKKGGGLSLLEDLLTTLISQDRVCELWLSSTLDLEDLGLKGNYNVTWLFSPRNLGELLNPRILFNGVLNLKRVFFSSAVSLNIFLMPSPFDWIYYKVLRIKGQYIVTCLHDLKSHPGERWPTLCSTLFRLRISDIFIVFSNHLASELQSRTTKEIYLATLPRELRISGPLDSDAKSIIQKMQFSELPVVLLIGRQRKYKDVEAFQKLAEDYKDKAMFIIAGEGSIEESRKSKIVVLNRWLSNKEFMLLIDNSDILFFPYSEASQSGNIPLAMSRKKLIVATAQPGLTEQLSNYPLKVVYDGSNSGGISLALTEALKIHLVAEKFDENRFSDHVIPLSEVIDTIDFNLTKRE